MKNTILTAMLALATTMSAQCIDYTAPSNASFTVTTLTGDTLDLCSLTNGSYILDVEPTLGSTTWIVLEGANDLYFNSNGSPYAFSVNGTWLHDPLGEWGGSSCATDINNDDFTGIDDILLMLVYYGTACD